MSVTPDSPASESQLYSPESAAAALSTTSEDTKTALPPTEEGEGGILLLLPLETYLRRLKEKKKKTY
jgi:hypothetical protein